MASSTGMGQSDHTLYKQKYLKEIITTIGSAINKIVNKPNFQWADKRFHWIDAFSGSGKYTEKGVDGSPLIFQQVMKENGWRYSARCIDIEKSHIESLNHHVGYDTNFELIHGDGYQKTTEILSKFRSNCFGAVYLDPNGNLDWDAVAKISHEITNAKRIDFLFHIPATTVKRDYYAGRKDCNLIQSLKNINKKHWYVCYPPQAGSRFQWIFLLGTNFDNWKGLQNKGFLNIETDGQALINKFNHSKTDPVLSKPQMSIEQYIQPQPKPIPTLYRGYNFRSRLEARWATFFDKIGLRWEYEIEGFETPYGRYLPDFFIPSTEYFIEVKPSFESVTCRELNRVYWLNENPPAYAKGVIIVYGIPKHVETPNITQVNGIDSDFIKTVLGMQNYEVSTYNFTNTIINSAIKSAQNIITEPSE